MELSHGIYNFSNIRYAAPPLGDLRFRAPVPPQVNRSEVQSGTVGRICPQATPLWSSQIAPTFVETQLVGLPYTGPFNINASSYAVTPQDPRTTEDCLFLDVVVPQSLFHKARNSSHHAKAPVMVWIYGGGYTSGEKSAYDPSGLIHRSMEGGKEGIVYVALNYRVSILILGFEKPELSGLH
jgi:Carboxylesterase type B